MVRVRGHVAARIEFHSQLIEHAPHRSNKAHRNEYEIRFHRKFSAGNRLELWRGADTHSVQLLNVAIAGEFCSRQAPIAHATFFVRAFDAQLHWPEWP